MSLTSDEVNYLIYRYLLENGFQHSAFSFWHEGLVGKSNIDMGAVPAGALISFVQKGLQYVELEAHVSEDGTEVQCDEKFSLVQPHKCQSKRKRKIFDPYDPLDEDYGPLEAPFDKIIQIKGHDDLVTSCCWNPTTDTLASSSVDSSTRLWDVDKELKQIADEGQEYSRVKAISRASAVMKPKMPVNSVASQAVVSVAWNSDGTYIATGCMDGRAYIWTNTGEMKKMLKHHKASLSAVRWNKKGNYLVTTSLDKTAVVWDTQTGKLKQRFDFHSAHVIDVDWRNEDMFATCSDDGQVIVCLVGQRAPVKKIDAHQNDVNVVRWHPEGTLLASASDDGTVKVWSLDQDTAKYIFKEHEREVSALAWGKMEGKDVLASGSLDTNVKIWDMESNKSILTFERHAHPVTVIAFSPNQKVIASIAHDRLHVWDLKTGQVLRTYKSAAGLNELSWNSSGTYVAVCASDNSCVVLDVQDVTN